MLHFKDISDVAASCGWTIPVKITQNAYDEAVEPRPGEELEDRLHLVIKSLTAAAKRQKHRFVLLFVVPSTPLREGYSLWAGVHKSRSGPEVMIGTPGEVQQLSRFFKKL